LSSRTQGAEKKPVRPEGTYPPPDPGIELAGIISPFAQKLSLKFLNLTQKEIQIANLIKEGKTTKEIARFMDLSKFAIDTHRAHLRSKLGLTNKKANLRTCLSSLMK
jgi:DNA-binding NarL/FixJ family response regulator